MKHKVVGFGKGQLTEGQFVDSSMASPSPSFHQAAFCVPPHIATKWHGDHVTYNNAQSRERATNLQRFLSPAIFLRKPKCDQAAHKKQTIFLSLHRYTVAL